LRVVAAEEAVSGAAEAPASAGSTEADIAAVPFVPADTAAVPFVPEVSTAAAAMRRPP
jgi:hypothetical protein